MTPDPPKFRPLERFWPYAELPEQPTDEELAALDPDLHEALFGSTAGPFRSRSCSRRWTHPQFARALELARGAAEFREIGAGDGASIPRAVPAVGRRASARCVPDRRHARTRPRCSSTIGRFRMRANCGCRSSGSSFPGKCRGCERHRTRPARLEARTETARSRVQHVLRGAAAQAALGNPGARRGDSSSRLDRTHIQNTGDPLPLYDAAVAVCRPRGSLGPRHASARGRAARAIRAADTRPDKSRKQRPTIAMCCTSRRSTIRCTRCASCEDLYESLAAARREVGRAAGAVPQVRGAGEVAGGEDAGDRRSRGGVPRRGQGRQGELHRARAQGCASTNHELTTMAAAGAKMRT